MKKLTEEHKKNLSNALKKAHKEGRAWNIGKSRWNNKPSKAEELFKNFLERNGYKEKIDFYQEFPFSIYSADFYFPKMSLVIEIDGRQHKRFKEYMERDKRKDIKIKEFGVNILRISWRALFYDSKNLYNMIEKLLKESEKRIQKESIKSFSLKQLEILGLIQDEEKEKKMYQKGRKVIRKFKKMIFINERLNDLKKIGIKKGSIEYLSKKWNISHTQVRRFIRIHFPEFDKSIRVAYNN